MPKEELNYRVWAELIWKRRYEPQWSWLFGPAESSEPSSEILSPNPESVTILEEANECN